MAQSCLDYTGFSFSIRELGETEISHSLKDLKKKGVSLHILAEACKIKEHERQWEGFRLSPIEHASINFPLFDKVSLVTTGKLGPDSLGKEESALREGDKGQVGDPGLALTFKNHHRSFLVPAASSLVQARKWTVAFYLHPTVPPEPSTVPSGFIHS